MPLAFITAKTGKNVKALLNLSQSMFKQAEPAGRHRHAQPGPPRGRRGPPAGRCARTGTRGSTTPPRSAPRRRRSSCSSTHPSLFDATYQRYLLNVFREKLPFHDVPIKLYLRARDPDRPERRPRSDGRTRDLDDDAGSPRPTRGSPPTVGRLRRRARTRSTARSTSCSPSSTTDRRPFAAGRRMAPPRPGSMIGGRPGIAPIASDPTGPEPESRSAASTRTTRREFLKQRPPSAASAGRPGPAPAATAIAPIGRTRPSHLKLSLAAYSLPRLARRQAAPRWTCSTSSNLAADMGLDAVELTSYYFPPDVDADYLHRLKQHAFMLGPGRLGHVGRQQLLRPARPRARQAARAGRGPGSTARPSSTPR